MMYFSTMRECLRKFLLFEGGTLKQVAFHFSHSTHVDADCCMQPTQVSHVYVSLEIER